MFESFLFESAKYLSTEIAVEELKKKECSNAVVSLLTNMSEYDILKVLFELYGNRK